ncbi:FAD-dependent oxidoreductase [Mesorhizobium sp. Z1-4]|uniref:NAD(P)/FAD-dependent oxidoreductase n=1 Tax=Mesorhizobium sp. Z1-4 TaxID=2448478 RepID=UPI000FDAA9AF|nr:FAD-dependent oxidoreductase [Mesorhizobium sp. Z1-4]
MDKTFDIVVVGAGIAGVSAACELARTGLRVAILEMEQQPGYHATGRSAAILAQSYGNSVIRRLTRASEHFFRTPPAGFADHPLLSPRPILHVARADQAERLRRLFDDSNDDGKLLEWLDAEELAQAAPHLREGYAVCGFRNKEASDIDVNALLHGYLRLFRQAGGELHTSSAVGGMTFNGGRWTVETAKGGFSCRTLVNAAGAWAAELGKLAGARDMPLTPLRRSAVVIDAPEGLAVSDLPMVIDADEEFYIKPEAGKLMASPGDETPSPPCDAAPEEIDIAICIDRIEKAFGLDVRRIDSKWAGLRSFLPDRTPVCGFDADAPSFFWLAGQGGYGVQTAPAMAWLTAAIVTRQPPPAALSDARIAAEALSPSRIF